MYTIKQAAALSGVGAPLIRAWERRYGVVAPVRTPAGYRLYDDANVAVLRAMRGLIGAGWSAAQAAQGLLDESLPVAEWAEQGSIDRPVGAPARRSLGSVDPGRELVEAAATYDAAGVETALDEMFARGSYETVVDDHVLRAAVALGEAWADGRVDVAGEHMASAAIGRRLAIAYGAAARTFDAPQVLVGLPPASRHELGALAVAVALRRRGLGVLYLGTDVPVASWVDAVRRSGVRAAVIGVVTRDDVAAADAVRTAISDARPEVIVALGGAAADQVAPRGDGEGHLLPPRVADAAAAVERILSRVPHRSSGPVPGS